jgi:hypothetical protein
LLSSYIATPPPSSVSLNRHYLFHYLLERLIERRAKCATTGYEGGGAKEDDSKINPLREPFPIYSLCAAKDALQEA